MTRTRSLTRTQSTGAHAGLYDEPVSEPRPGDEPGVYTLPEGAFRVREGAAAGERPAPPAERVAGVPTGAPAGAPTAERPVPESPASVDGRRRRRVWDVVLTIVLLLLGAGVAVLGSVMALLIVVLANGCGAVNCDYERLNLGLWVALTGPWATWAIALVVSIVLLVRRRLAFWMPLLGIASTVGVWFLGTWVASTGVG